MHLISSFVFSTVGFVSSSFLGACSKVIQSFAAMIFNKFFIQKLFLQFSPFSTQRVTSSGSNARGKESWEF